MKVIKNLFILNAILAVSLCDAVSAIEINNWLQPLTLRTYNDQQKADLNYLAQYLYYAIKYFDITSSDQALNAALTAGGEAVKQIKGNEVYQAEWIASDQATAAQTAANSARSNLNQYYVALYTQILVPNKISLQITVGSDAGKALPTLVNGVVPDVSTLGFLYNK